MVMSLGASDLYTDTAATVAIATLALTCKLFGSLSLAVLPTKATMLPNHAPANVPTVAPTRFTLFSLSPLTSIRETVSIGIWIFPLG